MIIYASVGLDGKITVEYLDDNVVHKLKLHQVCCIFIDIFLALLNLSIPCTDQEERERSIDK
jgi:hypothetical protein